VGSGLLDHEPRWLGPLALGTIYVVWGSTYLAIRVMVETIPPLLGAGVRFALAGAIFYVFLALRRGRPALRFTRAEAFGAGLVGVLLLFGGNGLVTIAEQDVPSALTALLIASVPLWIVLLRGATGDRVASRTLVSVLVGFGGLALLLLPGERPDGAPLGMSLLLVLAAVLWALGSFSAQRVSLPRDPVLSTSLQMLIGGGAMALVGLAAGEAGDVHLSEVSLGSGAAWVYLVLIGSLVAFTSYTWLLQNAPISQVATYAYVNPVVALLLGWLILSEEITPLMGAGAAVIVASVAMVVREESGSAEERPAA
jgi:drug/metabolite transporter (DMT)-like permease